MGHLKYRTRGGSDPQGKPCVYFCCHPKDLEAHFAPICREILATQDLSLWFADATTERDDDHFFVLTQMQLFVMPVTRTLLCEKNVALDKEFHLALEKGIPVLPIMLEKGLETLYAQKCGDLQFLDRCSSDATAISYKRKLQTYLDTILIGDALTQKIRAAFDAYVFLSYRKKDRQYAQELMRLIHKNEFCRDIAIWYDEFLTLGEDFNDSIRTALKKSDLFVLTLTPNVVNEPNYIMSEEYPLACEEGKPILPAEMVPTDRQQLYERFEGISEPVDAHNGPHLSESLLQALKKLAIKEKEGSAEHDFFIGLAYLNGIDVEIDREKGLALIASAAEDGLLEAAKKLFDIYLNGAGAPRNISLAMKWLERASQIQKERYLKEGSHESLLEYLSSLAMLAHHAEETVGSRSEAIARYTRLNDACKQAYGKFPTIQVKERSGSSSIRLAQLYHKNGDIPRFEHYADEAITYLENLHEEMTAQLGTNVAAITFGDLARYYALFDTIADLCFTQATCKALHGDSEAEERYIKKGVEAAEFRADHSKGDERFRLSLAGAYCNASKYYLKYKRFEEAELFLQKGYELANEVANVTRWLPAGKLVISFGMLKADLCLEQGQKEKALDHLCRNVLLLEASDLTPAMKGLLCTNYERVIESSFELEDYQLCAQIAERCLRLYNEILVHSDFLKVQTRLCQTLAICNARIGKHASAIAIAEKLMDVKDQDFLTLRSAQSALEYAESCYLLARTYHETKDLRSAIRIYSRGISFSKLSLLQHPEVGAVAQENTVEACLATAGICIDMGKPFAAKKWMGQALTIRKRAYKAAPDPQSAQKLSACYHSCARLLDRIGKEKKAQKYIQAADKLT